MNDNNKHGGQPAPKVWALTSKLRVQTSQQIKNNHKWGFSSAHPAGMDGRWLAHGLVLVIEGTEKESVMGLAFLAPCSLLEEHKWGIREPLCLTQRWTELVPRAGWNWDFCVWRCTEWPLGKLSWFLGLWDTFHSPGSKQPEVTDLVGVSLLFSTPGKEGFLGPRGSPHVLQTNRQRPYFREVVTRET